MSRDRFSPWATSPEYVRPAPIIRQPVRPEEIRARIAAEDATREGPGAAEYIRRIRDAADDTVTIPGLDISYSPMALGMNAIPFSDEILGLATDVLTPADYDEAQRATEQARYEASAAHPFSALAGGVGQAAITAPISIAGAPTGSTALIRTANAVSPGLVGGAVAGALGGALTGAARGEDRSIEDRARQAVRGAAPAALAGGAIGTTASALGAAGNALAGTRSALGGWAGRIAGGALTGAGYGVASTPDLSGRSIGDLPGLAMEAPGNAAVGGAMGGAASTLGEAVAAVPRFRTYAQHLFDRLPREIGTVEPIPSGVTVPVNEAAGEIADAGGMVLPGIADDLTDPSGYVNPATAIERARRNATVNTGDVIEDIVRTGLRQDPATARLQSLGMTGPDIDRATARFGNSPTNLVNAAREYGLLPSRPYDPAAEMEALNALHRTEGNNARMFRARIANGEGTVAAGPVADDIRALAEPLANSTAPGAQSAGDLLNRIADDLRYGRGVRPQAGGPLGEPIMPPERTLSGADLLREIDQYSADLRRAYETRDPSVNQDALMSVRNLLAQVRDRYAHAEFAGENIPGIPDGVDPADAYARTNRGFQVASALRGRSGGVAGSDRRQYGSLRGMLGSMQGGQIGYEAAGLPGYVAGRLGGFIADRTAARYLPSLIATANEGGFAGPRMPGDPPWPGITETIRNAVASPAVPPRIDAALQGVERLLGTNPSAFGRLEGVLRGAASRGTLAAVVTYLASTNPEFAALVQRISPEEEQRAQQQTIESAERDPLLIGADPSAPPPVDENDDGTDELIYGTPAR